MMQYSKKKDCNVLLSLHEQYFDFFQRFHIRIQLHIFTSTDRGKSEWVNDQEREREEERERE